MGIRKVIQKRVRRGDPAGSVFADVNTAMAATVGGNYSRTRVSSRQRIVQTKSQEAPMREPEERRAPDASSEERGEQEVETVRRAAPIDEDVAGELNAVLPDDHPGEHQEEASRD